MGLQAVACAFDQILETLQNSKSVSTLDFSDTIGLLHESMYEKRGARSDDIAVPAITKQNTSSASSSRLLSSLEQNRNKPTKKQNNTNLDVDHLGIYIPKNRSCGLCGLNGHTRTNCVLKTYRKFLDMQDICKLQTILTNPNALVTEAKMNSKTISSTLPSNYICIVIWKRLYISYNQFPITNPENFCFECHVIGKSNKVICDRVPYTAGCVAQLLGSMKKTTNKVIIDNMIRFNGASMLPMNYAVMDQRWAYGKNF